MSGQDLTGTTIKTEVYILVDAGLNDGSKKVVKIKGLRNFSAGDDSVEKIDITTHDDLVRVNALGLTTPGTGSITLLADSREESHRLLYEIVSGETADSYKSIKFAVGDGSGYGIEPTLNGQDWSLPTNREWVDFTAKIASFPLGEAPLASAKEVACVIERDSKTNWGYLESNLPAKYDLTVGDQAFVIKAGLSQYTTTLAVNATSTEIATALNALNVGTFTVSGNNKVFTITATNPKAFLSGINCTVKVNFD